MKEYTTDQVVDFLAQNEIFQQPATFPGFLREDLESFLEITQVTSLEPGSVVFNNGDKANSIILILQGEVDIFIEENGKKIQIATVGEKSFVGEMGIIDESTRSATVMAKKECLLVTILDQDFWLYFKLYPGLAINLIKVMNKRFKKRYSEQKSSCQCKA